MNDKEMTAEILRRLRLVPEHKSDINFPEFRWCAGLAGSRRADAFFIQPRPPYFSITYEVKVDRWDFSRDMAEFGKHRKARQFSNFFYYATSKGLIDPADIPEWAGLVEFDLGILADEYTQGMSVVKQAPLRDREDPDWGLIADLGDYDCQWQLVDTDWFLPQNRERVYFVGCAGAFAGRQVFPLGGGNPPSAVMSNENKTKIFVYPRGKNPGGLRDGSCPTITANSFQQNIMVCPVVTPGRHRKKQNGRLMKNDGDPSFTLTARESPGIYDGHLVRKLTPLECERLQGFPDGWTEYGADGKKMSDSVRYKALGNAVSVPVPEAIAGALFNRKGGQYG